MEKIHSTSSLTTFVIFLSAFPLSQLNSLQLQCPSCSNLNCFPTFSWLWLRLWLLAAVFTGVVTQNGCSNRSSSGSHWWSLSPWTISPFESPLQTIQCCCFRPGRDVIFAASSCEHLTIFAMALIGNGNFMCPQTVSISLALCTRKNLQFKINSQNLIIIMIQHINAIEYLEKLANMLK